MSIHMTHYTHVYTYAYTHAYTHADAHVNMHADTNACPHAYANAYTHVDTHVDTQAIILVSMYTGLPHYYSYDLYSYGLHSYRLYSYGLCRHGLCSYSLYSYGHCRLSSWSRCTPRCTLSLNHTRPVAWWIDGAIQGLWHGGMTVPCRQALTPSSSCFL